ncbi:MAG: alpha/beta hydrolase fold domain-containing protein [Planctomycetota bacterium]
MSKRLFCVGLIVSLGLVGSQRTFAQQITVDRLTDRFDANKDGVIEASEAKDQLKRNFNRIDANSDGKLDRDELVKLVERLRAGQTGRNPRATFVVPDDVKLVEDVAYREGESKKWKLDLFLPRDNEAKEKSKRPAIVFIHGGGWRSGDKGGGQWRSQPVAYAQKGYVCISVNYRLTDETSIQGCIEDCKNAVRWLRANAEEYNVDPDRIGAYGNSAGAHLVSVLGLADEKAGLEGDGPYQDYSSAIQAVVCSAPPTDLVNWDGKSEFDPRRGKRLFGTSDLDEGLELAKKCSPVTYVKTGIPFLVIHGTADRTVPVFQGDSFVEALKKVDADVTYIRVKGAGHGVFGQASEKTGPAMEEFFERTLKPESKGNGS